MVAQGDFMMVGQQPQQQANYYQYQMGQVPPQLPPLNQMGGQPPLPSMPQQNQPGFMLHNQPHSLPAGHPHNALYLNGQQSQPYYSSEQFRGYPTNYTGEFSTLFIFSIKNN